MKVFSVVVLAFAVCVMAKGPPGGPHDGDGHDKPGGPRNYYDESDYTSYKDKRDRYNSYSSTDNYAAKLYQQPAYGNGGTGYGVAYDKSYDKSYNEKEYKCKECKDGERGERGATCVLSDWYCSPYPGPVRQRPIAGPYSWYLSVIRTII